MATTNKFLKEMFSIGSSSKNAPNEARHVPSTPSHVKNVPHDPYEKIACFTYPGCTENRDMLDQIFNNLTSGVHLKGTHT